jgi:hypothetical protein
MRKIALAGLVLVILGAITAGGYAVGNSSAPTAAEANVARTLAAARAEGRAALLSHARSERRGRQTGLRGGRAAALRGGRQAGSDAGQAKAEQKASEIAAAQAAAAAEEAAAAAAASAIPARCQGIAPDSRAYTMCLTASGFPDSPDPTAPDTNGDDPCPNGTNYVYPDGCVGGDY